MRYDLNLLPIFVALMEERSVTRAAERLGMTQPALSNALARLRLMLQDQLFIRERYGIQPTPIALELAPSIAEALARLDDAVLGQQEFDPANAATDMGLLAITAGAAREALDVERIDAVADMGYYKGEDIEACEAAGITPYVARPERGSAVANGRFPKERFTYDPAADAYHCPGGQLLDTRCRSVTRGHVSIQYSSPAACAACTIRARCTGGRWRRINRWENEAVLDRMAKRLAARPDILNVRRETVEHPFGSIKQWMNQGAFLMRGLEKVSAEFSLTAFAYNLRRAITIIGIPDMMRALKA